MASAFAARAAFTASAPRALPIHEVPLAQKDITGIYSYNWLCRIYAQD
jgi:hypothetical protein